jgi:hypothetical protein
MNGRTMIVLGAAAALLIGGGVAAIAQDSGQRAAPGTPGMMAPGDVAFGLRGVGGGRMRGYMAGLRGLDAFDVNGDGAITQAEIEEVRANRLLEFDTNGDRRLTLGEYQALWLDAMHEYMVDQFQDHDDDGDAVVTLDEFLEPFANTVARLDADGDGRITDADAKARVQNRDDGSKGRGVRFGPRGLRSN